MLHKANTRAWNGKIQHNHPKEVQNSIIGGKSDVDAFLGCRRVNFEILPRGAQQ
jgi:hypothetical protein